MVQIGMISLYFKKMATLLIILLLTFCAAEIVRGKTINCTCIRVGLQWWCKTANTWENN